MTKMFNVSMGEVSNNRDGYITSFRCGLFSLVEDSCGDAAEHLSRIEIYEATDDELIIYGEDELIDYSGGVNSIKFSSVEEGNNYFMNNYKQFTKYKHLFKKNSSGYYWYGTEVA